MGTDIENDPCGKGLSESMMESRHRSRLNKVNVARNSGLLTYWMVIWPFSLISVFTADFFRTIRSIFAGFYQRISAKAENRINQVNQREIDRTRGELDKIRPT